MKQFLLDLALGLFYGAIYILLLLGIDHIVTLLGGA